MPAGNHISILIVDDRPEQRLSLAAALGDLGANIVGVPSGREALRALLKDDFALILLDVNMPGMDGFETAALIRQRQATEHTPIIFITAYSDDTHALRGYELGAVDYILSPVEPQALRTKVSAFVELFRKNEEVQRQAASLRQRASQLHRLTEVSLAINSETSVDGMLRVVASGAAAIIGAHQAAVSTAINQNVLDGKRFVFLSAEFGDWHEQDLEMLSPDMQALIVSAHLPARMSSGDLELYRKTRQLSQPPEQRLPMRGWMAAPLNGRDGRALGALQLSDKVDGEFTEDDEALLVQLAQMASVAIENILYSQEREANRLKDEFLSTLSHELRTPLQAIFLWTQMLRTADRFEAADVARGLEVIERSAKAQAKLIEDLLDVSRIINNKLSVELNAVDLGGVIAAAMEAVRPVAMASQIELLSTPSSGPCRVCADAGRLQQIIWNLLSNAVKFTPRGGRVEVKLERLDSHVRIRVSDSGRGIPADFLPHIFERFRQADSSTSRAQGGLGIGLFVVRRLTELHGGTVWAESGGDGKGSTFTVELPLMVEETQNVFGGNGKEEIGPASPYSRVQLNGVEMMVVDDEDDARESLAMALRQYGARVTAVGSAAEALAALDNLIPDILVCDVGMPGEDGYSFIRKLRARDPERGGRIPAAAVTAYARSEDRARALVAGFDTHISKPVEPSELVGAVRNLLRKAETQRS